MQQINRLDLNRPLITDSATSAMTLLFSALSFVSAGRSETIAFGLSRGIVVGSGLLIASALPWVVPILLGRCRNPILRWFRLFYVQVFYLVLFNESIQLSSLFYRGRSFDRLFYNLDELLFGMQPSQELYRLLPDTRAVVELFFAGYGFYFLLFSLGVWLLFLRGKEREAFEFFSVVTIGFYLLYLVYCAFPVMGPKYFVPELRAQWYGHFEGYFFTNALKRSFASLDLYGAAFPSAHAAISTVSLLMNFRHQRIVGALCVIPTLVLYVATVYLYAHYAVDTIAGIAVGVLYFLFLPGVLRRVAARHDTAFAHGDVVDMLK